MSEIKHSEIKHSEVSAPQSGEALLCSEYSESIIAEGWFEINSIRTSRKFALIARIANQPNTPQEMDVWLKRIREMVDGLEKSFTWSPGQIS